MKKVLTITLHESTENKSSFTFENPDLIGRNDLVNMIAFLVNYVIQEENFYTKIPKQQLIDSLLNYLREILLLDKNIQNSYLPDRKEIQ